MGQSQPHKGTQAKSSLWALVQRSSLVNTRQMHVCWTHCKMIWMTPMQRLRWCPHKPRMDRTNRFFSLATESDNEHTVVNSRQQLFRDGKCSGTEQSKTKIESQLAFRCVSRSPSDANPMPWTPTTRDWHASDTTCRRNGERTTVNGKARMQGFFSATLCFGRAPLTSKMAFRGLCENNNGLLSMCH